MTPYYYIIIVPFVLSFPLLLCSYLNQPTTANPTPATWPPYRLKQINSLTLAPYYYIPPKNNTLLDIADFFLCPKKYYTKNETASHFLFSNPKSKTFSETKTDLETQRAGGSRIGIPMYHVLRNR